MDDLDPTLVSRYLEGSCSASERAAIEQWADSDPANSAELDEIRRMWRDATQLPSTSHVDAMWTEILGKMREPTAVACGTSERPGRQLRLRPQQTVRVLNMSRQPSRLRHHAFTVIAAVLIIGIGLSVFSLHSPASTTTKEPPRVYSTGRGQRANIRLSDGSSLILAPESRLTVPGDFDLAAREVLLEGEAFFVVIHNSSHPFRVRARDALTEDVGTRFDVRAYAEDSAVTVAVTEGAVTIGHAMSRTFSKLRRGTEGALLRAGDVGKLDAGGLVSTTNAVRVGRYVDWARGRLEFVKAPLPDVARSIGRWYDLEVRVPDASLAARLVTAEFSTQSPTAMLDALAIALNADVLREGRVVTFRPKP